MWYRTLVSTTCPPCHFVQRRILTTAQLSRSIPAGNMVFSLMGASVVATMLVALAIFIVVFPQTQPMVLDSFGAAIGIVRDFLWLVLMMSVLVCVYTSISLLLLCI